MAPVAVAVMVPVTAALTVLASCGSDSDGAGQAAAPNGVTADVQAIDNSFRPRVELDVEDDRDVR